MTDNYDSTSKELFIMVYNLIQKPQETSNNDIYDDAQVEKFQVYADEVTNG